MPDGSSRNLAAYDSYTREHFRFSENSTSIPRDFQHGIEF